jgi:hypothetical protein
VADPAGIATLGALRWIVGIVLLSILVVSLLLALGVARHPGEITVHASPHSGSGTRSVGMLASVRSVGPIRGAGPSALDRGIGLTQGRL